MTGDNENKGAAYSADYRNAYPRAPESSAPPARRAVPRIPAPAAEQKRPVRVLPPAAAGRMGLDDFLPDASAGHKEEKKAPAPPTRTEPEEQEPEKQPGPVWYRWGLAAAVLLLALAGAVLIAVNAGTRSHAAERVPWVMAEQFSAGSRRGVMQNVCIDGTNCFAGTHLKTAGTSWQR